jgi:hypothetical protein
MIKSLVILILAIALAAGSFLSRPKPEEFAPYIKQQMSKSASGPIERFLANNNADSYLKSCTVKDRYLWIAVEKDGKTVYTGAFNHWFGNDPVSK